jgi:hypothetical protein
MHEDTKKNYEQVFYIIQNETKPDKTFKRKITQRIMQLTASLTQFDATYPTIISLQKRLWLQ